MRSSELTITGGAKAEERWQFEKDAVDRIYSRAMLKENIIMITYHSESLCFFCKFLVQHEESVWKDYQKYWGKLDLISRGEYIK